MVLLAIPVNLKNIFYIWSACEGHAAQIIDHLLCDRDEKVYEG